MNRAKTIKYPLLLVLTLNSLLAVMAHAAEPPASVKVYAQNFGDRVVYHYRVINHGPHEIAGITIGYDTKNRDDNDVYDLRELPIGWNFDTGIPATSVTTPPDWEAHMLIAEESLFRALAFGVKERVSAAILPGQTLDGFLSITLPKADDAYRSGHATVYFTDYPSFMTLPLELADTAPPTFSVSLTPATLWPPNGKPVPVTATVTVKDDYDPNPAIKLESITASEPLLAGDIADAQVATDDRRFTLKAKRAGENKLGRVYTVTYSATDASGNKATATAEVIVPHDQGK
jgi:hypothetical protein